MKARQICARLRYQGRQLSNEVQRDKASFYTTAEYRHTCKYNPIANVAWLQFLSIDWFQLVGYVEAGRVTAKRLSAVWYQMFASFDLHNQLFFMAYWITIAIAVFCYQMARRHGRIYQNFDMASRWHIGLHVFANISNIMLYYGFSLQ